MLSTGVYVSPLPNSLSILSCSPLDMVKTRLQNQGAAVTGGIRYSGPIDVARKIIAAEGMSGMYRGLKCV